MRIRKAIAIVIAAVIICPCAKVQALAPRSSANDLIGEEIIHAMGLLYDVESARQRDDKTLTKAIVDKILQYPSSPERPDLVWIREDTSFGIRPDLTFVKGGVLYVMFEAGGKQINVCFFRKSDCPRDDGAPLAAQMVREIDSGGEREPVVAQVIGQCEIPRPAPSILNPHIEIGRSKNPVAMMKPVFSVLRRCQTGPAWERTVKYYEDLFNDDPGLFMELTRVLIARDRETKQIAGVSLFFPEAHPDDVQMETGEALARPIGNEILLGVLPEFQGQGLSKRLIEASEDAMRTAGAKTVFVRAARPDSSIHVSSYQIYRRLGYRHSRQDHMVLVKDLAGSSQEAAGGVPGRNAQETAGTREPLKSSGQTVISGELKAKLKLAGSTGAGDATAQRLFGWLKDVAASPVVTVLEHAQFRALLPEVEWDQLNALYRLDPAGCAAAAGMPVTEVHRAIIKYIFSCVSQKGENPEDLLKGKRDYLPADKATVERLLEKVQQSGQKEYSSPSGGLVMLGEIGGSLIADPDNPFASPQKRFREQFAIAGVSVWEGVPYKKILGVPWGYTARQFYALYKKRLSADSTRVYPMSETYQRDQRILQEIADKNPRVVEQEFMYPSLDAGAGTISRFLPTQAVFYTLGSYSFVIPRYLVTGPGSLATENMPVYLVAGPLNQAVTMTGVDKCKIKVCPLPRDDAETVKSILKNAPRDKRWLMQVSREHEKKGEVVQPSWAEMITTEGYNLDKEFLDGYILREIEIFLNNKTKEEIEALRILDVGCGQGTLMRRIKTLIRMKRPEVDVGMITFIGVEPDPALREAARHRGLNVVAGDILNLPFKENSFDMVIAEAVLVTAAFRPQEGKRAVGELYRVAKPMKTAGKAAGRVIEGPGFVMMDSSAKGARAVRADASIKGPQIVHGDGFVMWAAGRSTERDGALGMLERSL